jgi:starch phosphorylase
LGDGKEHHDDPVWDNLEAEQLYNILEQEVVPEFYNRDKKGIPTTWISRMRESMAQLTPRFSADRTVREYTEQHYLPAATAYLERIANKGAKGKQIIDGLHTLEQKWNSMYFGKVKYETIKQQHKFEVQIYFNDLDPDSIEIQLFADGINKEAPIVKKMTRGTKLKGDANGYLYDASVNAIRPAFDYTARAIPYLPNVSVPLEISRILWEH